MPALADNAPGTGAGVRKPAGKVTCGRRCGGGAAIVMGIWTLSVWRAKS